MRDAIAPILALCAATIAGCAPAAPRDAKPTPDAPEYPERAPAGVELRLMNLDDSGARVARALAPHDTPGAVLDPGERAVWRDWGLRWIEVPTEELDATLASQRPTRPVESRDLGVFPRWRPLIRTGAMRATRVAQPGGSVRELSGRPRLIARAWEIPEITGPERVERRLRLEVALQLVPLETRPDPITPARRPPPGQRGPLLGPGALGVTLDGDTALVLVGVDPEVSWVIDETGAVRVEAPSHEPGVGPGAPDYPSMGAAMLARSGAEPRRVLLVLVPRTGERGVRP